MKEIVLTQNKVAWVDDADFAEVSKYKWHAYKHRNTYYAARGIRINGKKTSMRMHQFLCGKGADHKDGNGLNNTRSNLRPATSQQNSSNRGVQRNNTSGFKGVYWDKQTRKWRARIMINGKSKSLGLHINSEDAARAYDAAAKRLFGEFARCNFHT